MFIWQILSGDASVGIDIGLIELCRTFMQDNAWTPAQIKQTETYMTFLAARCQGKIPSGAHFLRSFVLQHPKYQQDSEVSDEIIYDMCKMALTLEDTDSEARAILLGEFAKAQ